MSKPRVLVTYSVKPIRRNQIVSLFEGETETVFLAELSGQERNTALSGADVLLSWNPARELKHKDFDLLNKLQMLQILPAGADHVPFRRIPPNVLIAANAGAYSEPIAEHVLAMALALAKNLFREHLKLAQGEFNQTEVNSMLHGSICGILGFGGIGKAVGRLMRCLGVRIHAVNSTGRTEEPVNFIGTLKALPQLLPVSDVLVISLPLTRETRALIGKRELEMMKPDAILINVGRGDIIDEGALYEHLSTHPDFKAGIDAWWFEPFTYGTFRTNYPFFILPNLLGSPHNSAMVPSMNETGTRLAVQNVRRFLADEPVAGVVKREEYI